MKTESKIRYLKDPNLCPYCDSEEITSGIPEMSGNFCYVPVACRNPDCQETWTEEFELVDVYKDEEFDDTKPESTTSL